MSGDRPAENVPERVGRYRVVRELGRGGMGRVFLAEEETAHFRRSLALKLVDRPGAEDEAVRRFRDEVRILASLEHPGLARFLDGGRSPEGIWYLALEYVDGRDLLEHARAAALTVQQRVELFLEVLEAVAYAHGRGVIHRDLKPSNVIVGRDGRPRLLDFGISKLVDGESGSTTLTRSPWQPMTPAYASPEQFRGEPVSMRSDVYSLGVVLYELLTGRRPFAKSEASQAALLRAVLDSDPEPPSTAVHEVLPSAAEPTETPPRRLGRAGFARELDAVCLQALRRDPAERYADAAAFRDDLRRWQDGEPVEATRWSSRARLVARLRHRGLRIALATGIVGGLAAGAVLWSLRRGESPPSATPALRAFPFDPSNPPPAEASERRLAEAPDDLAAGAALALRLARDGRGAEARLVIGRLRQVPSGEDDPLVDYAEGRIASLDGEEQRALVFYTRARDRALETGRSELLGTIRTSRAATLSKLGQRDASRAELELARGDSEAIGDLRTLYRTLNGLALEHLQRGEIERGVAALEAALAAAETSGLEPLVTLYNLAVVRAIQGRPDLGEPLLRRLIEHHRREGQIFHEGEAAKELAILLRDLGRPDEAAVLLERSVELLRDEGSGNELADALQARGQAALEEGRLEEIEPIVADLTATAQRYAKPLPLGYANWLSARRDALGGDFVAARKGFAEARRLLVAGGDLDLAAMADLAWAQAEADAGDGTAARRIVEEALGRLDQPSATEAGFFATVLTARLEAEAGNVTAAREDLAALGAEAASLPGVNRRIAVLAARAAIAVAERRGGDARADLATALELARGSRRKLAELELRLELARLEAPAARRAALDSVEREAGSLAYGALAERARRLADDAGARRDRH